eukprot:CAMPEP_0115876046 /NCGR_PEP_ID=MMETSP0287-20121206/25438_1 /TAXON_ID=412157 /ORGANISM="Chrysochromulina rotalis, Strain UIO044" /LENGTH=148 /DNA_ID=CAMNT_0003331383 /DNA_START=9 /DNA_END=455 /DNA_ORIENTATION=+
MLPPPDVAARLKSKEEPSKYPSGQDTSFQNMTEMPYRFTKDSLETCKQNSPVRKSDSPIYATSSSVVGQIHAEPTDMPMRWYGRNGMFTSSWVAESKTMTSSALSTSIDRSNVHPTQDQGWSGHLGLQDYNIANLKAATFVGQAPRSD